MPSNTILYQVFLSLHLFGLALGLGSATIADITFIKVILKNENFNEDKVTSIKLYSKVIWAGLLVLAVSGTALFLYHPNMYLSMSGFVAKMIFVAILIINGLFLNIYVTPRLSGFNFYTHYNKGQVGARSRKLTFVIGAISTTSWYAVLLAAMFKTVIHMPLSRYIEIYLVVLALAICSALVIEKILAKNSQPVIQPVSNNNVPVVESITNIQSPLDVNNSSQNNIEPPDRKL